MDQILKNIKTNRRKHIFSLLIPTLLFGGVVIFIIYLFFQEEDKSLSDYLILIFPALMAIIPTICMVSIIKDISIIINPLKDPVFKKYGSPKKIKKILDEIDNTKIYEDNTIVISKNYIYDGKDFDTIVAKNDILRVHKIVRKVNGVTNYFTIDVTDKYGHEFRYDYQRKDEELVDQLIAYIGTTSNNAKVGWSQDTMNYVHKNKENAMKLYCFLQENNIKSIIDDRDELGIGTKIKDATVIGTPKMIVIGNQFDGKNYVVEDTKTNEKCEVPCENIITALQTKNTKRLVLSR